MRDPFEQFVIRVSPSCGDPESDAGHRLAVVAQSFALLARDEDVEGDGLRALKLAAEAEPIATHCRQAPAERRLAHAVRPVEAELRLRAEGPRRTAVRRDGGAPRRAAPLSPASDEPKTTAPLPLTARIAPAGNRANLQEPVVQSPVLLAKTVAVAHDSPFVLRLTAVDIARNPRTLREDGSEAPECSPELANLADRPRLVSHTAM